MAFTANCDETRKITNRNIVIEDFGLNSQIYDHIHKVIGYPAQAKQYLKNDKEAMAWYNKLETELFDLMVDNYVLMGYEFNPKAYMDTVESYIQKATGARFKNAVIRNKRTLINVASRLIEDINFQRKAFDKDKTPTIMRLLIPPDMSTRKYDRFGIMSQLANFGGKLIEIKREATAKFRERLDHASAKYVTSLQSKLPNLLTEEYLMGGVDIRVDTIGLFEKLGAKLQLKEAIGEISAKFMGSKKNEDGSLIHQFRYEYKAGEWKNFTLTQDEISTEELRNAVIDAYSNKLINKLGNGQTRYVEWHSPAEHSGKTEYGDETTYDPELWQLVNIFSRAAIKNKNRWTSPEFHYVTKGGVTYRYVMIKQPEGRPEGEVYKAFIVSHRTAKGEEQFYYNPVAEKGKKSRLKESALKTGKLHDLKSVGLEDGFVTSDYQREFGNHVGWDDELKTFIVKDYKDKNYADFYRMPVQPHPGLVVSKPGDSGAIKHGNLWETLAEDRIILKDMADFIERKLKSQHKFLSSLLQGGKESKLYKILKEVLPEERQAADIINNLVNMAHINSRVTVSKDGTIYTPDGTFETKYQNYWPIIYEDHVYLNMLKEYMDKILFDIENADETVDVDKLKEEYAAYENMYRLKTNDYDSEAEKTRLTIAQRNAHLKHRSKFTDPTQRRMDGEVLNDYIERTADGLVTNDYMNMLLDVIYKLAKTATVTDKLPEHYIDIAINRVKMNTNDPTMMIRGAEYLSPQNVADGLNKVRVFGTGWRPQDVMDNVLRVKALITGALLRIPTAIINRTQVINIMVKIGLGSFMRVSKEINKDMWQVLINRYGINDPLSWFETFLTSGGGPTSIRNDMGTFMFPGANIPIPTRVMLDYLTMAKNNRRKAIQEGLPALDKALDQAEMDRIQRIKSSPDRIAEKEFIVKQELPSWKLVKLNKQLNVLKREQKRTRSELHKRRIEELRENFLDLVLTPKESMNRKLLEAKIRKIHGDIGKVRLGRMVEFSLGWLPGLFQGLKGFLTLTEGEREMRQIAAVATLINYMENNLLSRAEGETEIKGVNNKGQEITVRVPNILLTQDAFNIARQAVKDTMFSMNANNLGDAFSGLGGIFGIFKSYTVNQMVFDYEVFKSFNRSGKKHEIPGRIMKAAYDMISMSNRKGTVKYDPSAPNVDHEAVQMLRLVMYRLLGTGVYETARAVSLMRIVKWIPQSHNVLRMTRGMESPLLGLPIRMAIRTLALAWADDEEEEWIGMGEDVARLFLPLVLTYPYFLGKELWKMATD